MAHPVGLVEQGVLDEGGVEHLGSGAAEFSAVVMVANGLRSSWEASLTNRRCALCPVSMRLAHDQDTFAHAPFRSAWRVDRWSWSSSCRRRQRSGGHRGVIEGAAQRQRESRCHRRPAEYHRGPEEHTAGHVVSQCTPRYRRVHATTTTRIDAIKNFAAVRDRVSAPMPQTRSTAPTRATVPVT